MINVVITNFSDFGDYTTPLIESMRRYEKNKYRLFVIDNGSKEPYPAGNYHLIRYNRPVSWSKMINHGAGLAHPGEWIVFLNDDVLCHGPFVWMFGGLDKKVIYGVKHGRKPPDWHDVGVPIHYIPAWIMAVTKDVFDAVGGMDEWYPKVGMDDIDFCWRAEQRGFPIKITNFPFEHLMQFRRNKWPGFKEQMQRSIEYFIAKKVKGVSNE